MEDDRQHATFNYQICTALDLTKIGMVLDRLVESGRLHPAKGRVFRMQASSLLASIRNANNEAFGKEPQTPI